MNFITVTDNNNKEFSINLETYISYVNDDMSTEANKLFSNNSTVATKSEPIVVQLVNTLGDVFDFDITDSEKLGEIVDIDVYIEATHSGMEINNGFYTGESMMRDAESYTAPYKKPFITNHDIHSEPIGRIMEADCIDSMSVDGAKAVNVVAKISDKEAIPKFLDGRYNTVSIGARPNTVTCNHCGKHILKDGKFKFCGHMRGESYDEKKATWNLEDLDYRELSVVNSPADQHAQVYKIKINTKEDLKKKNNSDDGENNSTDDTTLVAQILNKAKEGDNVNEPVVVDEGEIVIDNSEKNIEELTTLLDKAQSDLEEAQAKIEVLKIDNETLTEQLDDVSILFETTITQILNNKEGFTPEDKDFSALLDEFNEYASGINTESNIIVEPDKIVTIVKQVTNVGLPNPKDPKVITDDDNAKNSKEEVKLVRSGNNLNELFSRY